MDPYQEQRDESVQPPLNPDAYSQQYVAFQSEPSNQNADMNAPPVNPPEKLVYQSYPFPETEEQEAQLLTQLKAQSPPSQINSQQQSTQDMIQNAMPASNSVSDFDGISGVPRQTTGRFPQLIFCQHCRKTQITETRSVIGKGALWLGGGLCLLGWWICAAIPFISEVCQDAIHSCPECKRTVGRNNFCD